VYGRGVRADGEDGVGCSGGADRALPAAGIAGYRATTPGRRHVADAGVAFRSATEPFDTSTPVGRMLVQMLGVFAEFEREVIIDRVIAGMERKATMGLWNGGPVPIGYVKTPRPTTSSSWRQKQR
jgi:hypothetical protein